jgi:glycerophosphoryl diester phosphodiesterase
MEKKQLIDNIEFELKSFEEEKNESKQILDSSKMKLINELKLGSFDEMLKEIEEREINKKKETLLDKIFKLF